MEATKIDGIVAAHRDFFAEGTTKSVDFRLASLSALHRSIIAHSDAICQALYQDLHKSNSESYMTEIGIVLSELKLHIKQLRRWSKPKKVSTPISFWPSRSMIAHEPLGIVLIIAPWNYPFQLIINPLIGAISAGNCAVLKPSPFVPNINRVISHIIDEIFDPSYISFIEGGHEINQALLAEKFDHIFITGSPSFGRAVMSAAAQNLTPVTLELGGKSPCIVGESADIEVAARRIIWGKLLNAGQTCVAPDYILVHSSRKAQLVEQLIKNIKAAFGENPQINAQYPRIVNKNAMERLSHAMTNSGRIVYGGEIDMEDRYIAPTIIENADDQSPIMSAEIFGPILPINEFATIDQAVQEINKQDKPLALYYFGEKTEAKYLLNNTSSGGACINDTIIHIANHNLPFGGVGSSGMGRYHGKSSFELLSNQRSIVWSPTWIDIPMKYAPYIDIKWLKKFI